MTQNPIMAGGNYSVFRSATNEQSQMPSTFPKQQLKEELEQVSSREIGGSGCETTLWLGYMSYS